MAITVATALAALPAGAPALGASGTYVWSPGDVQDPAWVGVITITGDGAATSLTVNFIDGVLTLPYTPTGVRVTRIMGTDSSVGVPFAKTVTNISFALTFTAAPANATTQVILVEVYK
jgi:hypothetical protein